MLFHLLHLPFVILHFVFVAVLFITAAMLLRPVAKLARHRCASKYERCGDAVAENTAFEDYRRATLKRLQDEAEEFRSYLARLRRAAHATAFEAFLKSRRETGSSA